DKDPNAEQWVKEATAGKKGSLDGDWSSRYTGSSGTAKVKVVKDRVYVLYTETQGPFKGKQFLLEAIRDGDKLMGRWIQVGKGADDSGPFVGLVVGDE